MSHDDDKDEVIEDQTKLGLALASDVHHYFIEDHGDPRCGNVTTILGVSGRGVEKVR